MGNQKSRKIIPKNIALFIKRMNAYLRSDWRFITIYREFINTIMQETLVPHFCTLLAFAYIPQDYKLPAPSIKNFQEEKDKLEKEKQEFQAIKLKKATQKGGAFMHVLGFVNNDERVGKTNPL